MARGPRPRAPSCALVVLDGSQGRLVVEPSEPVHPATVTATRTAATLRACINMITTPRPAAHAPTGQ